MKTILCFAFIFLFSNHSWAGVVFGAAGAGTYTMPTVSGNTSTSKVGYGGALTIEVGLSSNLSIELDGLYIQRSFGGAGTTLNVFNTVRVPLLLEYHLASFLILKAGGFYDVLLTPLPTNFAKTSDMGASAGLAINIPFSSSLMLFVDGRYNYNVTNIASSGTLYPHDATALLGFKLTGK